MSIGKVTIYCSNEDISEWKSGMLLRKWKSKFPELIQDHHYNIINNNNKPLSMYTFPEYFTGMHYTIKGYKFLFEPYLENFLLFDSKKTELKNIQDKFIGILRKVIGDDNFLYLKRITKNFKTGQPDLFIYNEDTGDYFFAEVKFSDKLQEHQKKLIRLIGKRIPVKLVSVLVKQ